MVPMLYIAPVLILGITYPKVVSFLLIGLYLNPKRTSPMKPHVFLDRFQAPG